MGTLVHGIHAIHGIKKDIQGKTAERNGIFFKIPKVEIICFNTGICFLCIKTNIEAIS